MKRIWRREAVSLFETERRATGDYDRTLFVSRAECRRFGELSPDSHDRITWVENGVNLRWFSPYLTFDNPFNGLGMQIVFVGHMNYWPNVDAVVWFANEVLPLLRMSGANPRFHIVGANPVAEVRRLEAAKDIHVSGRVIDVRPYLAHADVAVAPLRIARGIQNKVLEAMAMGKLSVVSRQALEGIRAVPGRDILVAESAQEMARHIADAGNQAYPGVGAAARLAVEQSYGWSSTLQRLDHLIDAARQSSVGINNSAAAAVS